MILNNAGILVQKEWLKLPNRFKNIELHKFVVMPNHFHAIVEIVGATLVVVQNTQTAQPQTAQPQTAQPQTGEPQTGQPQTGQPQTGQPQTGQPQGIDPTGNATNIIGKNVGDMVGAFQSIVTVEYIRGVKNLGWQPFNGKLWQRNYYEHIIRNVQSYTNISNYIINNPKKWNDDRFYIL